MPTSVYCGKQLFIQSCISSFLALLTKFIALHAAPEVLNTISLLLLAAAGLINELIEK